MKVTKWSQFARLLKKLSLLQSLSVLSIVFGLIGMAIVALGALPAIIYHVRAGVIPEVSVQTLTIYLILFAFSSILMFTAGCIVLIAPGWYYQLFFTEPGGRLRSWFELQGESTLSKALWFAIPLTALIALPIWEFPIFTSTYFVLSCTAAAGLQYQLYRSGKLLAFWFVLPISAVLSLSTLVQWRDTSFAWRFAGITVLALLGCYALNKLRQARRGGPATGQLGFSWARNNESLARDFLRNILLPFLKAASVNAFGCFRLSVSWCWYLLAAVLVANLSYSRHDKVERDPFVEMAVFLLLIIFINTVIIAMPRLHKSFTKCALISVFLLIGILLNFGAVNNIPAAMMHLYQLGAYEARLSVTEKGRSWLNQQGVPYHLSQDGSYAVVDNAVVISRLGTTSTFLYRDKDRKQRFTLPTTDVHCVPLEKAKGPKKQ